MKGAFMVAEIDFDYMHWEQDKPMNVLAVDDDILSMGFLEAQITGLGHNMFTATDGQKALSVLEVNRKTVDVVLMDREMPVMDGITAVRRMKEDVELRNIPVIMVTGADSLEEMREGLDAGVFYYLTKPVDRGMLRSVLSAAVREARRSKLLSDELGKHRTGFNLIEYASFKFSTLPEAESLSALLANCFPEPKRVLPGLCEILINAVEHGNLGIGYDAKTRMLEDDNWREEVSRIQNLPENKDKSAMATINFSADGVQVKISDQGDGFDWQSYMNIDPARTGDSHGRGIARSNVNSFDAVTYNDKGNEVTLFVRCEGDFK